MMTANDEGRLGGTTYERVHAAMVRDIINGTLAPGSRLKVADLTARYKLSQMPIREALQRLQGEGLVVLTPNRGASVRSIDKQFIDDLYALRAALAAIIYADMFAVWSPELVARLTAIQTRYDAALERGDAPGCHAENQLFHNLINAQCRNSEVIRVMSTQSHLVAALRSSVGYSDERLRTQAKEHWAIVKAIARRDLAAALAAAQAHGTSGGADVALMLERKLAANQRAGEPA